MADGLNDARAMRVAEILTDFRSLCHYMAQIQMTPLPEEYNLQGYIVLRQCIAEAQAILAAPFNPGATPANAEAQKVQLKAIIVDASVRRFRCQRAYLRATACLRWVHSRYAVTQGQPIHQGHLPGLQVVDATLQHELSMVSDTQVEYSLRSQDQAQEKWLDEDPSLATIRARIAAGH